MNTAEPTDQEFVRMFEACELPNESFHHRDHIRLAWIYLERYGELEARGQIAGAIRKFAAHHRSATPGSGAAQIGKAKPPAFVRAAAGSGFPLRTAASTTSASAG